MKQVSALSTDIKEHAQALNRLTRKRDSSVTLTANVASTTVTDPTVTEDSIIVFEPVTANAATELYGATMFVTTANHDRGSFIITHANNAQTDRTFRWIAMGD